MTATTAKELPSLKAMTMVLERILRLSDDLRRRFVATWLVYLKQMEEPEAARRARLREGAESILAREPLVLRHFPEAPDDAEIPPLPGGVANLELCELDEQMMWMPTAAQRQLIDLAQQWDSAALSDVPPDERRRLLRCGLGSWHAATTQ